MAITVPKKAEAPGYVVLVPARAGERDGCIWHWQSNPTKLVSLPGQVLTGSSFRFEVTHDGRF